MNRRQFFLASGALTFARTANAATPPWSARLLKGGFDGQFYWAGLAVSLDPNWKTYWRVPGDGGIAPQFTVTGDNLKNFTIHYPAPQRYYDESGVTVGYKQDVVFPIRLEPQDIGHSLQLKLNAFFGVCEIVCIPAHFEGEAEFGPNINSNNDQKLISEWLDKVPLQQAGGPVTKATVRESNGKYQLLLDLSEAVSFILVEGKPAHYFNDPAMMRGLALFSVSGVKSLADLRETSLRITVKPKYSTERTLEQILKVE